MPSALAVQPLRDEGVHCCTVGDRQYAIHGADVRQVVRAERMRPEPGAAGRAGTLEIGSWSVPVFSLEQMFGGDASPAPALHGSGRYIVVTGMAGELAGWIVDKITRADASDEAAIVPLPAIIGATAALWFDAVVRLGETSLLLLAPERLNPSASGPRELDATAPFQPAPASGAPPEPMVVIFSTPALPRCPAARYALSGRQVAAVVEPSAPLVVPGSAPHMAGLSWWRDVVVPVVDFREAPARTDESSRGRRLVARCGGRLRGSLVAFSIDPDLTMHRPSAEDRPVPDIECPPFAAGLFNVGGETVALLDLERLIR
jgi:chemotaxis signal transduction protein